MVEGWIKIHRKISSWEWYADSNTFHLFMHLLLNANYEFTRWQGTDVPRGSLVTGRKSLAEKLGLSEQNVRTSLERLKSTNEITSRIYNKFSIITITNYDYYQDINQISNHEVTTNQPRSNHEVTTSKERKKERKEEKKVAARQEALPFFSWLPKKQWEAFKEMRNRIKKPMTPHAEELALKKLEQFHLEGKDVAAILDFNILNNYQGIFEPKPDGGNYAKPTKLDLINEGIRKARAKREQAASESAG